MLRSHAFQSLKPYIYIPHRLVGLQHREKESQGHSYLHPEALSLRYRTSLHSATQTAETNSINLIQHCNIIER